MTTAHSPLPVLKAQADRIAACLKAMARGDDVAPDPHGRIAEARTRETVRVAIVMDDKTMTVEIAWVAIRDLSETEISKRVLAGMREATYTLQ